MNKKYIITWAHWVGKTSLLNNLQVPNDMDKLYEIARATILSRWLNPHNMTTKEYEDFELFLMGEQTYQENNTSSFISDRWVFDILAYSKKLSCYDRLKEMATLHLNEIKYTKVFYIPIEFPIEDDWVRSTLKEFQEEIDYNIVELLKEFNITPILLTWSLEERLATITTNMTEVTNLEKTTPLSSYFDDIVICSNYDMENTKISCEGCAG